MAFWEMDLQLSDIDDLLKKEDVTLEEILDDETVLQECKNFNSELLEFLATDENMNKMISHVVAQQETEDVTQQFKYASLCSEVLSCGAIQIENALLEGGYLAKLWGFFSGETLVHPLSASFVAKIFQTLVVKKAQTMKNFFEEQGDFPERLLNQMATPALVGFFFSFTHFELDLHEWLCTKVNLVDHMVELFNADKNTPSAALYNIVQFIKEVVTTCRRDLMEYNSDMSFLRSSPSPLFEAILSEATGTKLLSYALADGNQNALSFVLDLFIALVSPPPREDEDPDPTPADEQRHKSELEPLLKALTPNLDALHALLSSPTDDTPITTASGTLAHPFGALRLSALKLVVVVMRNGDEVALTKLRELGTVKTCLGFLSTFPENNLMHNEVQQMVLLCLHLNEGQTAEDAPMLKHVIAEGELIETVLSLWKQNTEEQAKPKGHRLGFMGYLVLIAQVLASHTKMAEVDQSLATLLKSSPSYDAWIELQQTELAATLTAAAKQLGGAPPLMDSDDDSDDFYIPQAMLQLKRDDTGLELYESYLKADLASLFLKDLPGEEVDDVEDITPDYGTDEMFAADVPYDVPFPEPTEADAWRIDVGAVETMPEVEDDVYAMADADAEADDSESIEQAEDADEEADEGDDEDDVLSNIKVSESGNDNKAFTGSGAQTETDGTASNVAAADGQAGAQSKAQAQDEPAPDDVDVVEDQDAVAGGNGSGDVEDAGKWPTKSIEAKANTSGDGSDEDVELEASYDQLLSAKSRGAVEVPLSPRGALAVRHISPAKPTASSPITVSAIDLAAKFDEEDSDEDAKADEYVEVTGVDASDSSTDDDLVPTSPVSESTAGQDSADTDGDVEGGLEKLQTDGQDVQDEQAQEQVELTKTEEEQAVPEVEQADAAAVSAGSADQSLEVNEQAEGDDGSTFAGGVTVGDSIVDVESDGDSAPTSPSKGQSDSEEVPVPLGGTPRRKSGRMLPTPPATPPATPPPKSL
eukprot:m.126046 g.126046  ORF g.126046 m.126046 type:complete len:987 (-) comp13816_c1_seq1:587-3547(-)